MHQADLIVFHISSSTPLRALGNVVRWHDDMAAQAPDRRLYHRAKARMMWHVITNVFLARHRDGQYDEA